MTGGGSLSLRLGPADGAPNGQLFLRRFIGNEGALFPEKNQRWWRVGRAILWDPRMTPALLDRAFWQQQAQAMRSERFSARALDAGGTFHERALKAAREALETFGAVHVQNTGLTSVASALGAMDSLGFSPRERFDQGGRTSEGWQKKWVEPGLRRLDYYPPDLYLLANNEVQYRRCSPRRVLFYCHRPAPDGGRTFLHSAAAVEEGLRAAGPVGRRMLENFERHGLLIETGFLDRRDPRKSSNYFQSWQERFGTEDAGEALARARASTTEYDDCWWREEERRGPQGEAVATLMTRITLSAFKIDPRDGTRHLRFPRIALGAPAVENGYRRYPLGNGEELPEEERELLRSVYLATREGIALKPGDLVLFDNLRYGHSRESFSGEREVYVGMAGELWDDGTEEAREAATIERQRPAPPLPDCTPASGSSQSYGIPGDLLAPETPFSARIFDAEGTLDGARFRAIREQFSRHGALHVRNTGLRCEHGGALPDEVLRALGFGGEDAFPWGGMSSGRTVRRALSRELRATDDYPPHLWLLPHNEVLYQRTLPARLLFFSATACPPEQGGAHVCSRRTAHGVLDPRPGPAGARASG